EAETFGRSICSADTRERQRRGFGIALIVIAGHVLRAEAETFGRSICSADTRERQRRGFGIALIVIAGH
ncbi:hypothetical protein CQA77_30460, partial [Klebsiella pneumoniae]